ncbi:MAG: hypothetical protein WCJ95_01345 [Mariniphaga sp.]
MNNPNSNQNDHSRKGNHFSDHSKLTFSQTHEVSTFTSSKYSVRLKVADSNTGAPVKGVLACIIYVKNPKITIFKSTAEKGSVSIRSLEAGTYQVTLKKAGYTSQIVHLSIFGNLRTVVNMNLESN